MEPVTHILTGACLARTGLNRRAAYATLGMAVAAEFPDIDTVWSLRGPVSGFAHHRGLTHTFLGLPFEAALLLAALFGLHHWRAHRARARARTQARPKPLTVAPVRWLLLYSFLLLALLSHLLLDYTNNYGLRPFLPFNPHWYAASIVFIFDPFLFAILVLGLVLPSLFGAVAREVGEKKRGLPGGGWPRAALVCVVFLWSTRFYEHGKALTLAADQTLQDPMVVSTATVSSDPDATGGDTGPAPPDQRPLLQPQRSLANPDPLSIFRWYTATDFGSAYRLGTADTRNGTLVPEQVLVKAAPSPATSAAEGSFLGRVYLDWSKMPWVSTTEVEPTEPGQRLAGEQTVVFQDLRFMGSSPLLHRGGTTPLTGTVLVNGAGKVLAQGLDGRFEK